MDRPLGRYTVPEAVRAAGYDCFTLAEFLGSEEAAQAATDVAWLDAARGRGLAILTRDGNLYLNAHELEAVSAGGHQIYWIGPKKGPGPAWAQRFNDNHERIAEHASSKAGPFVVKVQENGLEHAWP